MKSLAVGALRTARRASVIAAALALPGAAAAQLFLVDPQFPNGPIEASDPLVGVPIPGATPDEYRAHLIWNMRSGLNVAALQCQFSPYLRSVDNYNALLTHHSTEFANAYTALNGYFRRLHGAREGPRRFDDYSTQTYNNFSTLHAQYGFCQVASSITKDALAIRKGQFHQLAIQRMRQLRGSLTPAYDHILVYNPYTIPLAHPAALRGPDCSVLRGRERRRCEREG
jgi:hypothetical protein